MRIRINKCRITRDTAAFVWVADLVIMDLSTPVIDGFGALRLLREVPHIRDVPVVACTAHDTSTHKHQALSIRFNDFLSKPIDFRQLDGVLNQFLKTEYRTLL
jgi:CheY-like chemotaxis protein